MLKIINADVLDGLSSIESGSVHCVVTSPPYWGLRDYGTAKWEGGDEGCDHSIARPPSPESKQATNNKNEGSRDSFAGRTICHKCGARRIDSQIGLEATPDLYVEKMVQVFREVRRVLRDDGTCWVNLGDSYAGSQKGMGADGTAYGGPKQRSNNGSIGLPVTKDVPGLKPKDLVGIPWRVAFALQADGWWLRSDIIWSKPNPMPESVTDRPTKAHEYIFLLAKSERYFFDQDAVREPALQPFGCAQLTGRQLKADANGFTTNGHGSSTLGTNQGSTGRNIRTVWNIATQPYPDAHFATFPEEIAKRCIMAGCPVSGLVLDPFAGSGTVGKVALELGRKAVLIELNREYCELIERRTRTTYGLPLL